MPREHDLLPIGGPVGVFFDIPRSVRDVYRLFDNVAVEVGHPHDEDVTVCSWSARVVPDRTAGGSEDGRGDARVARRRALECDVLAVRRPGGGAAPDQQLLVRTVSLHQEQVRGVAGLARKSVPVAVEHDQLRVKREAMVTPRTPGEPGCSRAVSAMWPFPVRRQLRESVSADETVNADLVLCQPYAYEDEEGGTREIELVKFTAKKPE